MGRTKEASSILSAVDKLEGDLVRTRAEGLEDLRRILSQGRDSGSIDALGEDVFHKILEVLFRIIRTEKPAYVRASKPNTKTTAASRLTTASAALRLVVEVAGPRLKHKTISAVLDHVIELLPDGEEGLCSPIETDYLKIFRTILEHPPHVEHLRPKQWQTYVDFILETIALSLTNDPEADNSQASGQTNTTSRMGHSMSIRTSQSSNGHFTKVAEKARADELFSALQFLTDVSNAPLLSRMEQIGELMLAWLESTTSTQEAAFIILNKLLPLALTEHVAYAASIFERASRVIQRLWNTKFATLRDQMLITLLFSQYVLLDSPLKPQMDDAYILDALVTTIWTENERREGKDLLSIDDLSFMEVRDTLPLSMKTINPISDSTRSITAWATLSNLAALILALDRRRHSIDRATDMDTVRKKRKLDNTVADVFRRASSATLQVRVVALQLALFVTDRVDGTQSLVLDNLLQLDSVLLEDDPDTTSWLFILLGRCAMLKEAKDSKLRDFWHRMWAAASRLMSSSTCSRAACYLMERLIACQHLKSVLTPQYICDAVFSDGSSGPGSFTDSAIILLTSIISSGLIDNEKLVKHFTTRSLNWLELQWTLPTFSNRNHTFQVAAYGRPQLIQNLLSVAQGEFRALRTPVAPFIDSSIHLAALVDRKDLAFTRFALCDDSTGSIPYQIDRTVKPQARVPLPKHAYQSPSQVIHILSSKLKAFHQTWIALSDERASNINVDVVEIVTTACVLLLVNMQFNDKIGISHTGLGNIDTVWQMICEFCIQRSFELALGRVAVRILELESPDTVVMSQITTARTILVESLLNLVSQNHASQYNGTLVDIDLMESMDTPIDGSQSRTKRMGVNPSRQDLSIPCDTRSIFTQALLKLKIDKLYSHTVSSPEIGMMSQVINEIVSLNPEDLLLSRDLAVSLFSDDIVISRQHACLLLKHLAEVYLQTDRFERCEAALCFCLRIMTKLVNLWTSDEDDELGDRAYDIYSWFLNVTVKKNIVSRRVMLCMSSLSEAILRANASYATDSLQSSRTTLLQLLKMGANEVRFGITACLLRLFDGYVLAEHAAIFDDIVDNLPTDPDNKEGIALRLYVLAYLGARWHTILRQAVYHIFETAANVPSMTIIAQKCIKLMCHELRLPSPQVLLCQFAPQILYTWLERERVSSIPFQAFGYDTLARFVTDVKDELVAQTAMRASSEHAQQIVQQLGSSWDALLEQSFSRAVAYTIIADVCIQRSSQDVGKGEAFVIQQLGEARFASLLDMHLPEIVSLIMVRLVDDKGFEKAFRDDETLDLVAVAFRNILHHSSSQLILPPGQQPSFRAKYIFNVLDRLSAHAGVSISQLWTSASVVSTCRLLLDDARPAFGPLHACAVLRKTRVVICLADKITSSGYCLTMLLHSLRPFLTQFHCSEDAIGIVWYLLEQGRAYLQLHLSYVIGLSVAIFASLSHFVGSSQDSTTQESHYISTMSKAREFRVWLGEYLAGMEDSIPQGATKTSFVNITHAARQIASQGNSDKTTAEGSLLYYLFIDQASSKPLLSDAFFRLTIRSLCQSFRAAVDPLDDILGDDVTVVNMSPVLWSIANDNEAQDAFRVWSAQALGRAYAIAGPLKVISTSFDAASPSDASARNLTVQSSYQLIVDILIEQLWSADRPVASASEQTLQKIFTMIPDKQKSDVLGVKADEALFAELRFHDRECPSTFSSVLLETSSMQRGALHDSQYQAWASQLTTSMCNDSGKDPILSCLETVVQVIPDLASKILPMVVHIILSSNSEDAQTLQKSTSAAFMEVLRDGTRYTRKHVSLVLNTILYLRKCTLPTETTLAQRNTWLDVDFRIAAEAATLHDLYHTALLMLEIYSSQSTLTSSRSSRRSSGAHLVMPEELVAEIYRNVDDPDFFYGTVPGADIGSVVQKLCHEGSGYKALSFQSALFDSSIRNHGMATVPPQVGSSMITALELADLHGLADSFKQSAYNEGLTSSAATDIKSSLNLQQWDIWRTDAASEINAPINNAFRALSSTSDISAMLEITDASILQVVQHLSKDSNRLQTRTYSLNSLTILAEIKEAVTIPTFGDLQSRLQTRCQSQVWARRTSFNDIERILLAREALFGTIKKNLHLQNVLHFTAKQSLFLEINALRASLSLSQAHGLSQFSLNRAAYMSELITASEKLGLKVQAAIQYDLANTLWSQQEASTSLAILRDLHAREDLKDQAIPISLPEILTDLGQKLTEARLDRPDEITSRYLEPAIKALGDETTGSKAGRVYHNFAAFCDQQLRDPDNLDEYVRIEKLRNRKKQEVDELEAMKKGKEGKERDQIRSHLAKAQTWFKLDEQEWKRLKQHREGLIEDCLENYLRAMRACQDFPNDVLRFLALWLEQSGNEEANALVANHLPQVPSYKFAPLMNQLSSRILNNSDKFQTLLFDLMYRISNEHPFHSLYQVFATSKSKAQKSDTVGTSRHAAANKLAEAVMKTGSATSFWVSIHNINIAFVRVANEKPEKEVKPGSKFLLRKLQMGAKLEQAIQDMHHRVPPPTMDIPLRPDKNYSSVPTLMRFDPSTTIAGGVSAPKILTGIASDGSKHKMLLKGGNDDLRQDSIMEQVFEQVSNLLKDHRHTRQRKLGIRTYKVIPLTTNAGIIEFVKDTMPLHDYVLPAHTRYYPKDFKPNRCRKEISDAQTKSLNQRLQAYRIVVNNFHPVMRFFFMEHFLDPNEWFQKRLNYSRSTAAISMLGHVLGVGDRHGHNILLDTNTGEVVHIDLGVAFEAGRVLPVPEVVPFRLTRDLVDGMGLSGVEGVFRRCCNFTLEALRQDQEAIMTILDVLRWDPLYSWSISPLRLQRMQENQEQAATTDTANAVANEGGVVSTTTLGKGSKSDVNEPGEADRALAIVAKKLGKGLSVEATVNELIRQATDERNLAVLYCGWAAYA